MPRSRIRTGDSFARRGGWAHRIVPTERRTAPTAQADDDEEQNRESTVPASWSPGARKAAHLLHSTARRIAMVPTGRLELHGFRHCPSRQRVYQFHHVGGVHSDQLIPGSPDNWSCLFRYLTAHSTSTPEAISRSAAGAAARRAPGAAALRRPLVAGDILHRTALLHDRPSSCVSFRGTVRPRLVRKNTAARIAVVRDRKFAEPAAPKRLPRIRSRTPRPCPPLCHAATG